MIIFLEKDEKGTTISSSAVLEIGNNTIKTQEDISKAELSFSDKMLSSAAKKVNEVIPVKVTIPDKTLKEIFNQKTTKEVEMKLEMPRTVAWNHNFKLTELVLAKESLELAKITKKQLKITVDNGERYEWVFDTESLDNSNISFKNINLSLETVTNPTIVLKNQVKKEIVPGVQLKFGETEAFPIPVKVKTYVSGQSPRSKIRTNSKVYLYLYNPETKGYTPMPNNEYTVDEHGYVEFNINFGAEYILLSESQKR